MGLSVNKRYFVWVEREVCWKTQKESRVGVVFQIVPPRPRVRITEGEDLFFCLYVEAFVAWPHERAKPWQETLELSKAPTEPKRTNAE